MWLERGGIWFNLLSDRTEVMSPIPQECTACRRMTCFFTNRDGGTVCTECPTRKDHAST